MKYEQHNPLPLPAVGDVERVPSNIETVFDWKYALEKQNLLALYEKGKAAQWNATDLDWDTPVDLEKIVQDRRQAGESDAFNQLLNPPVRLDAETGARMNLYMTSWMISQFLHGEQGALVATARLVEAVPWEEAKFYAANQVADEARHVEVYHRYLTEKLGCSFEVNDSLRELLSDIVSDSRWDMTYLGMQIMVEGLALAAFGMMKLQLPEEPLIQQITSNIMADESRHVAFGVISLADYYQNELTSAEIAEREEFIIHATHLMRDRLLMGQVYERLDFDVPKWIAWAQETPFMRGFRQMLFSKIVPNLRRLGLLTPRVREEYDKLGILQFEHLKDSSEDPEVMPPAELVELLMRLQSGAASATGGPASATSGPSSATVAG